MSSTATNTRNNHILRWTLGLFQALILGLLAWDLKTTQSAVVTMEGMREKMDSLRNESMFRTDLMQGIRFELKEIKQEVQNCRERIIKLETK